PDQGYAACGQASEHVEEGNVGAGTGATVAKLHGPHRAVKGGLGTAAGAEASVVVGALASVNAWGEVLDENGDVLAGARPGHEGGPGPAESPEPGLSGAWPAEGPPPASTLNTTLVVVATNARLSKERAHLLAIAAQDGISETIRPAHTMWDGDTVFSLATGEVEADQRALESRAVAVVAEAIRRAVLLAKSVPDFPSAREGNQP
ncbi:MAG: P1 family peptidase, partial [Actinobacteria bacterium]|nr:P1 family peptidase [Actinomycetota bacterium]